MKVSINLVTWNGKKYLPYCFEAIARQTFRDFSLLILDNGSTDGTAKYIKSQVSDLKSKLPDLKIAFNDKNVGFAGGHNQAVRATDSEYVFMLNQDIILDPYFLEAAVEFLDRRPEVGAVTGKLMRWDFEKGEKTDMIDSAGLQIFKNHRVIELGVGDPENKWNTVREIFGVSGAAPIYRRKALEDVKLSKINQVRLRCAAADAQNYSQIKDLGNSGEYFDEDFFSYKEDVDLAYRLRLRGWQAWFLPEVRAWHDRSARATGIEDLKVIQNRKSKSTFVNYHSYKNHFFFLVKNLTPQIFLKFFPRIFWYEKKKGIYILLFETAILKSLGEFFRKLPIMWKKRKQIMKSRKVGREEIIKWLS